MYIEQVITACDSLYPNPYTKQEKYFWCDELSEMLSIKLNTVYETKELEGAGGKYLLPEGVTASMIDTLTCGGVALKKREFGKYGIECTNKELCIPKDRYDRVYVTYIKPYDKIRDIEISEDIVFGADYFLTSEDRFLPGDTLKITVGNDVYDNVFVLGVEAVDENKIKVITSSEFLEQTKNAYIVRLVMEETVCPPPYDNMYIDYLLGKIAYYQNDFDACNHHMALYNSKLIDYRNWVKSHPVSDYRETKLRNWW